MPESFPTGHPARRNSYRTTAGWNPDVSGPCPRIRKFLLAVALIAAMGFGLAQAVRAADQIPDACEICGGAFTNTAFYGKDPLRKVKRYFCQECSETDQKCWACGLPVSEKTLLKLDDGRLLCQWDRQGIVMTPEEARDLFQRHVREWQNRLSPWPPFPQNNIQVHLVNRDDFIREYRRQPHFDNPELLSGLTHSRQDEKEKAEHDIYVLTGLLRNQFLAVCAHEYGHAWLFEHEDRKRQLDKDTREGFCEWLAYLYMVQLGDSLEQDRIVTSTYTRDQIKAFIAAEKEYTFYRVMTWVLDGVDSWLDAEALKRILTLREKTPAPPQPPVGLITTIVPTSVPDELVLKGISTAGRSRFALINNKTLAAGESGKVRVGSSNVTVQCLEIGEKSVRIRVEHEAAPRELQLSVSR